MSNKVINKRPILVAAAADREMIENEDNIKAICDFFENPDNLKALIGKNEVLMDYNGIMACLENSGTSAVKTLIVLQETNLNSHLIPDAHENTLFVKSREIELLLAPFKDKFAYFDMFLIKKCLLENKKRTSAVNTVAYKPTQLLSITVRTEKPQKKTNTTNKQNGSEDTKKGICLKRRKNITK